MFYLINISDVYATYALVYRIQ